MGVSSLFLGKNVVVATSALLLFVPVGASAQQINEPLLETALPPIYDRGRNVSVIDRQRPEYQAVGLHVGGFTAYPSLQVSLGNTDNVLLTQADKLNDGFVNIRPRAVLQSSWSINSVRIDAGANLVRYFGNPVRNENGWYTAATGRYDATPDLSLTLSGRTARQYESRFSGIAVTDARGASAYQTTNLRALAKYEFARSRIMAAANFNRLTYSDVLLFDGSTLNQRNRDRDVSIGVLHYEYGLTPDTSVFTEVSYSRTKYDIELKPNVANRDSNEWKAVAGLSFDLAAPFRGSLAIGYVDRKFDSVVYRRLRGLSAAARVEYFPTQLTTVTLNLRREVEDANVVGSSGYFANSLSLRIDHELLRSLILSAGGEYQIDDYIDLPGTLRIFRVQGSAKYMLTNWMGLNAEARYSKRNSSVPLIGADIAERRAMIGVILQR
ncbi:outer membrane beta-barrel protein [Novosphingobium olei]|uniref:Outer membrane beta-barrel protein n=1 Tax=Novosphingobium olei TaxID=2728851 RepID=A0A7Y0BTA7_9SPHN|nr:outer membrane beta-barrel protein [Novosphingobium olei]NML96225.1 outer membrane beta-barrel protein [Novosphingobium olei]